jgi:hypothetical protein
MEDELKGNFPLEYTGQNLWREIYITEIDLGIIKY